MLNKVAYKQVLMVSLNVSITHTAVSEVCAASQSVAETRTNTHISRHNSVEVSHGVSLCVSDVGKACTGYVHLASATVQSSEMS